MSDVGQKVPAFSLQASVGIDKGKTFQTFSDRE